MASMADGIRCKASFLPRWDIGACLNSFTLPPDRLSKHYSCAYFIRTPVLAPSRLFCVYLPGAGQFLRAWETCDPSAGSVRGNQLNYVLTSIVCSFPRHLLKMNKSSSDLEKVSQSSAESLSPSFRGAHVSFTTGSTDSLASDSRTCSDGGNTAVLDGRASHLQSLQTRSESVARI